jgi:hypothetical protein
MAQQLELDASLALQLAPERLRRLLLRPDAGAGSVCARSQGASSRR